MPTCIHIIYLAELDHTDVLLISLAFEKLRRLSRMRLHTFCIEVNESKVICKTQRSNTSEISSTPLPSPSTMSTIHLSRADGLSGPHSPLSLVSSYSILLHSEAAKRSRYSTFWEGGREGRER